MLSVVVVDDDPQVRMGIKKIVKWEQYGVDKLAILSNGREAWEYICDNEVNLLITDIRMPLMDGFELSRRVKSKYPSIEIVFLSAYAEFEYAKSAIDVGVRKYILKPIDRQGINDISDVIQQIAKENKENKAIDYKRKEFIEHITEVFKQNDTELIKKEIINKSSENIDKLKEYYTFIFECLKVVTDTDVRAIVDCLNHIDNLEELQEYVLNKLNSIHHIYNITSNGNTKMMIEFVKQYIDDNISDRNLDVNNIAAMMNMGASYVIKIFKEQERETIFQYILKQRMSKAKRLIEETDLSIKEISQKVGYEDQGLFTRNFRRLFGVSPLEYRELNRK